MEATKVKEKALIDAKNIKRIAWTILLISSLYVAATTAWILSENRTILPVMEVLTIWAALMIVRFMAEIHKGCGENRKSHSLIALALTVCMAAVTIVNHFLYMTVLSQLYGSQGMPPWLLLDGWPSVTKGLECVSWGFFLGLAMLFASSVLEELCNKPIAWTMRVSGIVTLIGLIGPLLGNMNYYLFSTIGYSVGFLVLSIEMIVYFQQSKDTAGNHTATNGRSGDIKDR